MSKPDNYKNINDSFETGFENISNKELVYQNTRTSNEFKRQDIALEMNRRLIDEIREFNENSSRQTNLLIWLTIGVIGLTIVMLIVAIFNIVLVIQQGKTQEKIAEDVNTIAKHSLPGIWWILIIPIIIILIVMLSKIIISNQKQRKER